MWEQHLRLLSTINGGAIVALLAFIQAIWKDAPELKLYIASGIILFSFGLVFAVKIPRLREETVLKWRKDNASAKKTQSDYRKQAVHSLRAFIAGVTIVSIGFILNSL